VGYEKLVLVTRKTRLQELIARFNSRGQAKFYIEHAGGDFADYQREDDAYARSLECCTAGSISDQGAPDPARDRADVPVREI
jgi:hypothetical protein